MKPTASRFVFLNEGKTLMDLDVDLASRSLFSLTLSINVTFFIDLNLIRQA